MEIGANIVNTTCVSNATNCGGYGVGAMTNAYDRSEFYGSIHGCNSALYYNRCLKLNGAYITMSNAGMAKQIRSLCDVRIFGCSAAANSACADDYYPTTVISFGNCYGIGGQGNCLFCGTAKGNYDGFLNYDGILSQLADIGGSANIDRNYNGDIDWSEGGATIRPGGLPSKRDQGLPIQADHPESWSQDVHRLV